MTEPRLTTVMGVARAVLATVGFVVPWALGAGLLVALGVSALAALIGFFLPNVVRLAPWLWDNIKILIYWFIGSIPFVAYALARAWNRGTLLRAGAVVAFAILVLSGSLDVWRTLSGQVSSRVFDADAIEIAEQIKRRLPARTLILNAPTFNSPVVLTGRQSLMRYSGHLSSHGIDYLPRENDVRRIYEGGGVSEMLLKKYNIEYVLFSPEERNTLKANEEFFKKYRRSKNNNGLIGGVNVCKKWQKK